MSNKYLSSEKSKLLYNRLDKLSDRLVQARSSNDLKTTEQIIFESIRSLNLLYKDLTNPTFNPKRLTESELPDLIDYNSMFQTLLDDLTIIFTELENVETLSLENFNFASVEANKLFSRLKTVSSRLGDYILYSEDASNSGLYFVDSFNDLSKIDTNSSLLNNLECDINQEEGIVTLPINNDKTILVNITQTPIIDEQNSNGEVGNNQQLDSNSNPVQTHNDVNVILDDNPDTWFEYERVESEDSGKSLKLDLTINLGEVQTINRIVINPNNFGTRTSIKIIDILTSVDGLKESETSIKDDIPIAGFLKEDDENIFLLAPSTSKYAGKGIYTFTPRESKYIRFIFEQTESYIVNTTSGNQYRYAIGLRDINIYSLVFEPKGEIISSGFQSVNEIKKIILDTSQNPSSHSELAQIQYYLSPNNGQNWYEIQPRDFMGPSGIASGIPEILDFNTVENNAIITPSPVNVLKLKSVLSRTDENFTAERAVSFQQTTSSKSELYSIPVEPPFSFDLEQTPLVGSIKMSQPFAGARGKNSNGFELRGFEFQDTGAGTQSYLLFGRLSEEDLPAIIRPKKKVSDGNNPPTYNTTLSNISDFIHVFVAGEEWQQATQSLSSYNDQYGNSDYSKVFNIDLDTATLSFGNGRTSASPPENAYIGVYLDAEKLFFKKIGEDYFAKLNFSANLQQDGLVLKRYHPIVSNTEILQRGSREVHLENKNILDTSGIENVLNGTRKTFLNGEEELSQDGDYSIDIENGIIYLYTATSSEEDVVVEYTYQLIEKLSNEEWYWNDDFNGIFIKADSFESFSVDEMILPAVTDSTVFHLAHLNVIENSPVFNVTVGENEEESLSSDLNPFEEEILFVDGKTELYIPDQYPEKITATLDITETYSTGRFIGYVSIKIYSCELPIPIANDDSYLTSFSWSDRIYGYRIFQTAKDSYDELYDLGDYYLDRENNIVHAIYPGLGASGQNRTSLGNITYYKEADSSVAGLGKYSIDYKNGIVYTDRPANDNWTIRVEYEYSDYRVHYDISKEIPSTSYEVNNKTVTINPDEILGKYSQPEQRANIYYQVNYKYANIFRTNISKLKDYFTPVLKAYSLRMITDKDLF